MTWSYSGDPTNSNRDAVRFEAGLTDSNDQIIEDEELDYLLDNHNGILSAAAAAAEKVAAEFSRKADASVGDAEVAFSQVSEQYAQRAEELAKRAGMTAGPIVGGTSKDDKSSEEDRSDRVEPSFKRGQFDHVDASEQPGD